MGIPVSRIVDYILPAIFREPCRHFKWAIPSSNFNVYFVIHAFHKELDGTDEVSARREGQVSADDTADA